MYRLIYHAPLWFVYHIFINIPLILLGWILVPIAAACEAYYMTYDPEKFAKGEPPWVYHFKWRFMYIWDNYEDGIANNIYYTAPNMFLQIIYWSCLRNPTNNLRVAPILSCKIEPKAIAFKGSFGDYSPHNDFTDKIILELVKTMVTQYDTKVPQWFYCWQNWFHSNFYWQFMFRGNLYRFWIGTAKLYPTDVYGGPYGYREKGAGGVIQFKKVQI